MEKIIAAFALMTSAVGGASAAEVCYKLGDYVDILRLEVGKPTSGAVPHTLVYGNWFADTTPSGNYPIYSLPVTGAMEFDAADMSRTPETDNK